MRKVLVILCLSGGLAAGGGGVLGAVRVQQELDILRGADAPPNAIWIDSLDLSRMVQRRQTPRPDGIARDADGGYSYRRTSSAFILVIARAGT